MIYVVSGYRRSGTSAMMKALNESLPDHILAYQPGLERYVEPHNGWSPNPTGLYEVGQAWYMNPKNLRSLPDNSLVKIFYDGLPLLPRRSYTIIFMFRDFEEIQRSCERVEQYKKDQGIPDPKVTYPFDTYREYSSDDIEHVLGICRARSDVRLIEVYWEDVLHNSKQVFSQLGLPIEVTQASKAILK